MACRAIDVMFISVNQLANELPKDKPNNLAANALQEGLGGQFGEMRTMMQYLFQNFNFRGKAKQYRDLIKSVASEEIGHVVALARVRWMEVENRTGDN
jgi:Mn-containing catalase